MDTPHWRKQEDAPLFPDLLWSRPENKAHAGKLLLIGGNLHGFSSVSQAYEGALAAGIGECKALVPDSLRTILGAQPFISDFLPSTQTGSFNRKGLASVKSSAQWANAIWLTGDFGKNPETGMFMEDTLKTAARLALSGDSLDTFLSQPNDLMYRANTLVMPSFLQLQKLSLGLAPEVLTSHMGLVRFTHLLAEITTNTPIHILTSFEHHAVAAVGGQIITSRELADQAAAVVWWTQFPGRPLEALATGLYSQPK